MRSSAGVTRRSWQPAPSIGGRCWRWLERDPLTLLYAARDEQQNNAQVLAEWLEDEMQRLGRPSSPACLAGELGGTINDDG